MKMAIYYSSRGPYLCLKNIPVEKRFIVDSYGKI